MTFTTLLLTAALSTQAPRAITFADALLRAVDAPDVTGAVLAAAEKSRHNGRLSPLTDNPELTLMPGYRGNVPEAGPELQLDLSQSFNLSGLSGARRRVVEVERRALDAVADAALLERRRGIARAWVEAWKASARRDVRVREVELAEKLRERIAQNLGRGFTRADLLDADVHLADAHLAASAAEGALVEAGLLLSAQLGGVDGAPTLAAGPLPDVTLPDVSSASIAGLAEAHPGVRALQEASEAERAREGERRAANGWGLRVGVSGQRESDGALLAFAGVGLTLPVFEHGAQELGSSAAQAATLAGQAAAAHARAATELTWRLHDERRAEERRALTSNVLVPAAEEALRLKERLLGAGETTLFEVLAARRVATSAHARHAEARGDHALARIELSLLTDALRAGQALQ